MVTGLPLLLIIAAAILFIIIASAKFRVNPFLSLLGGALITAVSAGIPANEIIPVITKGFGEMAGNIGIIIIMGTIIGVYLEKSGAAQTIAVEFINFLGEKRIVAAMSAIGFLVGIPVFCDSGYILLSAPGKRLALQTGKNPVTIGIATATGLYATHVLVPPTPGPLAAAGNLGADPYLGMIILLGLTAAIPATLVGYIWATRVTKNMQPGNFSKWNNQDEETSQVLPPLWKSILPIICPLLLIVLGTVLKLSGTWKSAENVVGFFSNANIALTIGALSCMILFRTKKKDTGKWIEQAIEQAGPILLITAAGGAFGAVLKVLPVTELFKSFLESQQLNGVWLLPMIYLLAAGVKTSQGSSTAALVIVSSLLSPLLPALNIAGAVPLALTVVSISAGAMTISHSNDSYFWVISRFSGLTLKQTLTGFSMATFFQGLAVLLTAMLLWTLLVK